MHLNLRPYWFFNFPHGNSLAMDIPSPIHYINCHDKQYKYKACRHSKGSCHHCFLNGLGCLLIFTATLIIWKFSHTNNSSPFQRNYLDCTQSHQNCWIYTHILSQCKHCTKFGLPVVFKLSSQGRCYDLKVLSVADGVVKSRLVALLDLGDGPNHLDVTLSKKKPS